MITLLFNRFRLDLELLLLGKGGGFTPRFLVGKLTGMKHAVSAKNIPKVVYGKIDIRQYETNLPEKKCGESSEVSEYKGTKMESLVRRDCLVNQVALLVLGMKNERLRDIKIKDLCRELRINASFLSRKFHENRQYTLCEFIQQVKIQRAVLLLRQDIGLGNGVEMAQGKSLSINAISEHLGFSSTEYFIRCFKKRMGVPPHVYRKCLHSYGNNPPPDFFQ